MLDTRVRATPDSLVVDTTVRNTRTTPVHLDATQCGPVSEVILVRTVLQPEGTTYTGSLDGLKRLILEQQKSQQFPDGFAPRVVTGGSATPDCVRPSQPIEIAPGASIAERWESEFTGAYALAAVGAGHATGRATGGEAGAARRAGVLRILGPGGAHQGRAGR